LDTLAPTDDLLTKAFRLAYFIHGNKETAVRIVSGAMAKLEVAATAQDKRLYYRPNGRKLLRRPRSVGFRNRVTFNELHLLQRLIYIESEPYEKEKERASSEVAVGREELVIRFIKHLVRITLKRNSFYVTLGLSRLLYNYTTAETMGIYNAVVQDPDRVKDDYYYRSRKGVLMQEIRERFGDLVNISQRQRGEERFQADPDSSKFVGLVKECLSLFTPWDTPCLVPANYNPLTDTIAELSYKGERNEDKTEVDRIHAVLHPDCFQRLIKALGFHSPEQRLEVPHFFVSNEKGDRGESGPPSLGLGREDLNAIKNNLEELAKRRRRASGGLLRVLVDGVEYARLDSTRASHVRFNLDRYRELIEIRTADERGDLLLASHLLTYEEGVEPKATKSSIALEGGQSFSIVVSASNDASAVVDVSYKETNPFNSATRVFHRLLSAPSAFSLTKKSLGGNDRLFAGTRLIPISAFLIILICGIGVFTYLQRKSDQFDSRTIVNGNESEPLQAGSVSRSDASAPSGSPNQLSSPETARQIGQTPNDQSSRSTEIPVRRGSGTGDGEMRTPASEGTARNQESLEGATAGEETTRGQKPPATQLSPIDLKTVFVEVVSSEPLGLTLGEALSKKLQASNRFTLSNARDSADALLKVNMTREKTRKNNNERLVVTAQLLNTKGQVVWPLNGRSWHRTYLSATQEQIGTEILKDLLHDIAQLKRR
jgi:hypothetical protein